MNGNQYLDQTIKMMLILLSFLLLLISPGEAGSSGDSTYYRKTREYRFIFKVSSLDVRARGKVSVNDSDTEITAISPGGFIEIIKTTFGNKKELRVESDDNGRLTRTFFDNRVEKPYDPAGQRWLEDVLIEVLRTTGIAAESRVNRIKKREGVNGVLTEIGRLANNDSRVKYYDVLLNMTGLNGTEIGEIAANISRNISSSSRQGSLYRKYSHKFLASERSARDYFDNVARISSSSEIGYTLKHVIGNHELTDQMKIDLLQAVQRISSSSEQGAVLTRFNEQWEVTRNTDEEVFEEYFATVDRISSSSERGRVLRSLLKSNDIPPDALDRLFMSIERIPSSSEQGAVLREALSQANGKDRAFNSFFETVSHISSSSEQGRVLRRAIEQVDFTPNHMEIFCQTVERISSSSEQGSVLRALIPHLTTDRDVMDSYFSAVSKVSSSSEQGSILRKLAVDGDLDENGILGLLGVVEKVTSSSEQTSVMLKAAELIGDDQDELKKAYFAAAESISSSTDYRRVIQAIM